MSYDNVALHQLSPLDPRHDGRHSLSANPMARESVPYVLVLPEEEILACPYCWVDREGNAGGIFFLFGPGIGPEPIVEHFANVPMSPETNFDNWTVGDIAYQHDLKLRNASITAKGQRASLVCTFEAEHPGYTYGSHARGCPDWLADDRLEQTGRMKGVLTIDSREIPFDAMGARDHSWGVRDWQSALHWKWVHAQAGSDVILHFMEIHSLGHVDIRGYVVKDGLMAEVRAVETDFEHDDLYRQTAVRSVIVDSAGRTTRLDGKVFSHYPLIPGPHTTLNETGLHCTLDDHAGAAWVEFMWQTPYLEHIRESLRIRKQAAAAA